MDLAELSMLLESIQGMEVSREDFETAASSLSKLTSLPDDQKLQFYGLYKQSTVGDNTTSKPWSIDFVKKAKWDAWKTFEGLPQSAAMRAYTFLANQLINDLQPASDAKVPISDSTDYGGMHMSVSTFQAPIECDLAAWTAQEDILRAVVEDDIAAVETYLQSGGNATLQDSEGMTPLHFAADRGNAVIATLLLQHGADVNAVDKEGYTPLAYAVMCENTEIVEILMQHGADPSIKSRSGESIFDIDTSENDIIRTILLSSNK